MKHSGNVTRLALGMALALASAADAQIVNRFGVRMPMRDGAQLSANIWMPAPIGRHPTILIRTPYGKNAAYARYSLLNYITAGYAVVVQDTRGRGDSDGSFNFYFPEGEDGYDSIEWIAKQNWSNGRVGMDGGSYLGTVQWLAARERPPHLSCIAPDAASGRIFDEIPYFGGAFRLEWALTWLNSTSDRSDQGELNGVIRWQDLIHVRPLQRLDSLMGRPMRLYQEALAHPTLDAYWRRIQLGDSDFAKISVPSLTVTGWYDGDQPGALWYWDGMNRRVGTKPEQYLIIGPWTHTQTYLGGERRVGEIALDSSAILPIQKIRIQYFDWCLKQATPGFDAPRVRVFVPATNRWIGSDQYPLAEATVTPLYLASNGSANTGSGDGRLEWVEPIAGSPDHFAYDPHSPVPAQDPTTNHARIEDRRDVLVYSSEVMAAPLEIVGRVFAKLWAASDALDTDFTAKLLDVYPDGRAVLLGTQSAGVRRARYRHGYERPEPLMPDRAEEFSIELFDIGHAFLPGHRIRLEVSSSAAYSVDPNLNTGKAIGTDTTAAVAHQTVFHEPGRFSRLLLPVLSPSPK
jgi:hypothetical protein